MNFKKPVWKSKIQNVVIIGTFAEMDLLPPLCTEIILSKVFLTRFFEKIVFASIRYSIYGMVQNHDNIISSIMEIRVTGFSNG